MSDAVGGIVAEGQTLHVRHANAPYVAKQDATPSLTHPDWYVDKRQNVT